MTATADTRHRGARPVGRTWQVTRITVLTERAYRVRLFIVPLLLGLHLLLYDRLWVAVYADTESVAGMSLRQTLTYSLMALLVARIRWSARLYSKDSVSERVREGTIIYWFLRPVPPQRYYMWRQAGDMAYGACWAGAGYIVLVTTGVIDAPRTAGHALVFLGSLLLGQVILYYLGLIVDLCTFWLTSVSGVVPMYYFAQDLLSGAVVPLWFMPGWLVTTTSWLPFSAGINVPLSLYTGRVPLAAAAEQLGLQMCWVVVLACLTRFLWSRASLRVTAQGG